MEKKNWFENSQVHLRALRYYLPSWVNKLKYDVLLVEMKFPVGNLEKKSDYPGWNDTFRNYNLK